MSIISNAYDALLTRLDTLYPSLSGWNRLPNPYKPEENTELFLRQGYGVAMGPGQNTNRQVNCKFSVSRDMVVILTRKYDALENDAVGKAVTEKQLFEDQYALINDLEQDISINGQTMYTRYISDGGIEYVRGDTDRFLILRTVFSLEYMETFA